MTVHPSAEVAPEAEIASSAVVWALAQVREGCQIGEQVVLGRGAYVGPGVQVGARSKVQNYALIYEPAVLGEGVFIGPAVVLTNDRVPRATNADGSQKTAADWQSVGVAIDDGASIGARAVCVAPVRVGRWAMVAAGAVVTHDVPDYALVVGVPAKQVGWVGREGYRLVPGQRAGEWVCPSSGGRYRENGTGSLQEEVDPASE